LLSDQHCSPCTTAFGFLQSKAEAGEDPDGLFDLAKIQTDRAKKVLGTVAPPGPGPLQGLTAEGAIRVTESPEAGVREPIRDRTQFSRSALQRSVGVEVASTSIKPATVAPLKTGELAPETEVDAADVNGLEVGSGPDAVKPPPEVAHSAGDGHGHGSGAGEAKASAIKSKLADAKQDLTEADKKQVQELQQRDAEVRAHEQAHKSAAGGHAGSISLSYRTGPDGRKYAVEGSVPVDISPVRGDPQATIQKMQTVQRAALAPAEPSSADRRVAARASQSANKARMELQADRREEREAPKAPKKVRDAEEGARTEGAKKDGRSGVEGSRVEVAP
jgi:hypothetical protein